MEHLTADQRQDLACGRLPLRDGAFGRLPDAANAPLGFTGFEREVNGKLAHRQPPTTCPTYTTSLPEVIEIARAARWKDNLPVFCGGRPSELVVDLIDIYDAEVSRFEHWAMTPNKDGGGLETRRRGGDA